MTIFTSSPSRSPSLLTAARCGAPFCQPDRPADVPGEDVHLLRLDAEPHGDSEPADVNALRGCMDGQHAELGVPARDAGAALHGHVLVPVHVDVHIEDAVGTGKGAGHVAELVA